MGNKALDFIRHVACSDLYSENEITFDTTYLKERQTELVVVSHAMPTSLTLNDLVGDTSAYILNVPRVSKIVPNNQAAASYTDTLVIYDSLATGGSPLDAFWRVYWLHPSVMACTLSGYECDECPYFLICQLKKVPVGILGMLDAFSANREMPIHNLDVRSAIREMQVRNLIQGTPRLIHQYQFTDVNYNALCATPHPQPYTKPPLQWSQMRRALDGRLRCLYGYPGIYKIHPGFKLIIKNRIKTQGAWLDTQSPVTVNSKGVY